MLVMFFCFDRHNFQCNILKHSPAVFPVFLFINNKSFTEAGIIIYGNISVLCKFLCEFLFTNLFCNIIIFLESVVN